MNTATSSLLSAVIVSITLRQWLVISILIAIGFYTFRQHLLSKHYPPTPWNLPIVGNLPWIVWTIYRSGVPAYECLRQLRYTYGNVFALNLCGQLVVFVNDFASIKKAFNNPCLCDRPEIMILKGMNGNRGLAFANGNVWAQQRRFTQATLRSLGVGRNRFEELITIESEKLAEAINRYDGELFDPQDLLLNISSNVISLAIFGKRYDYDDEKFLRLQRLTKRQADLLVRIFPFMFLPCLRFVPSKAVTEFEANSKVVTSFIKEFIEEHKNTFNSDNLRDYTDVFISELKLQKGDSSGKLSGLDDSNMAVTIANLFSAGTGTTATTLRWILLCMIRYPDVQSKVQGEMDKVIGRDRLPMFSDKLSLPYTQATLFECQRIASVSRLGVPHACNETTELCGFTIPKGAIIMPNKWAIHHDPDLWPDPEVFEPGRYLDDDGKLNKKQELIPFGIGRRICVGDNLAKMELFLFFTHILHRFTLRGSKPDMGHSITDIGPAPEDFQLRALKRD